ncbi:PAS domain S-box-containing protein [Burkholderia sp. GAS332]|nr:PAS domain S-box-containing protein [Burkholderia sp. GAS332]
MLVSLVPISAVILCAISALAIGRSIAPVGMPIVAAAIVFVSSLVAGLLALRAAGSLRRSQLEVPFDETVLADDVEHTFRPALLLTGTLISHANLAFFNEIRASVNGDNVIGLSIEKIVHPADHAHFKQLLAKQREVIDVVSLVRADGSIWRTPMTVLPVHGADVRMVHFAKNIEDASPPPAPTQNSETALLAIARHSGDILFAADADLCVSFLSPNWDRPGSVVLQTSLGRPLLQLFHPDDRAGVHRAIRQALRPAVSSSSVAVAEARLSVDAEPPRWFEVRMSSAWASQSANVQNEDHVRVVGIMCDITSRRFQQDSLQAQRRSLRTLVDNMPGMIYRGHIDRQWSLDFVSEGSVDLTGYTPAEMTVGGNTTLGTIIHPEDREYVWMKVQMQLARREGYELTYRIIDKSGDLKWVSETGRGVYAASGELLGVEGFIIDVTARQVAQEDARRRLFYDATTGLLSHSLFVDRLQFLLSHVQVWPHSFAVAYIRITPPIEASDNQAEDLNRIMVELGKRLAVFNKERDAAARHLESDFVVLLSNASSATPDAESRPEVDLTVIDSILAALSAPVRLAEREIKVKVEYGVAQSRHASFTAEGMIEAAFESLEANA